jgi:hypothetical protein
MHIRAGLFAHTERLVLMLAKFALGFSNWSERLISTEGGQPTFEPTCEPKLAAVSQ